MWPLVSWALLAAVSEAAVLLSVVSAVSQVVEIVEPVLFTEKDRFWVLSCKGLILF